MERLPDRPSATLVYERRDCFAAGLLALWMRGQTAILPPDVVTRPVHGLEQKFSDSYILSERNPTSDPSRPVHVDNTQTESCSMAPPVSLKAGLSALCIFTSGSTGRPTANDKTWRQLAESARPISSMIGLDRFDGPAVIATVPSYHMYGFELTILAVLKAGASVHVERAVYPADIARCLREVPSPRVLVSTPFHLRALVESGIELPAIDHIVSATAPMAPTLADAVEQGLRAPVYEIYGFTEAGSVATRRTVEENTWTMREDLTATEKDGEIFVECTTVGESIPFPDNVDIIDPRHIQLRERSQDIVNVAGKRASLAGLSTLLTQIDGVEDGVFALSAEDTGQGAFSRLLAIVVAPDLSREDLMRELRGCIEPAFLPRHVLYVKNLPRNETGKLPKEDLDRFISANL